MLKKDKARFEMLAAYGCIVCRLEYELYTVPQIHHLRAGRGTGQKKDHSQTIPLCPDHHMTGGYGVAFHSGQKEWELRHGTEEALLRKINRRLEPSQT